VGLGGVRSPTSFTAVVITGLFNAYFVAVVAGNAPWATFAWTAAALSMSYMLIVLSAPRISAYVNLQAEKNCWQSRAYFCVINTEDSAWKLFSKLF
jgi:hypothetical protein